MKDKLIFTALLCVTLYVPLSLFSQDFRMNGTTLVSYNGRAANVTIPEGVVSIGREAFAENSSLTSVTIPTSVISIGEGAFANCSSLASITIPSRVNSIGDWAFGGCENLTSITVDNQNRAYSSVDGVLFTKDRTVLIAYPAGKQGTYTIPAGVASIGEWAFHLCGRLTGITIPSSVTHIGEWAFYECSSLRTITVSKMTTLTAFIGEAAFPSTARIAYSD